MTLNNVLLWQFSSTMILPPCPANYDLNVVVDDAKWDAFLGGG
jgi:hypothetical protein